MSSSATRGERMVHQDFIARIRFSNALPPPPNPPKLLDIPNVGLSSGQYTNPGFASRLAREQPLNIEADAELGMPLDLVGMPGIFDGDESSIQAPPRPPQVHPHDRPLLRPLATLGKPKMADSSVSFLRRSEYISSAFKTRSDASPLRPKETGPKRPLKRKSPEPNAGSPEAIRRKIDKEFNTAQQQLKDPGRLKHPSNKSARIAESYPLLPDLDAFPDSGAYVTLKFLTNPVASSTEYDTRLLSGVFVPIDATEAEKEAYKAQEQAHERDPANVPAPSNLMNYNLFLADTARSGENLRRKFDVDNPDRDDDGLYTSQNEAGGCFNFNRLRAYETANEQELDHQTKYTEEIILSYTDAVASRPKAAYYYPVMQRSTIRPQRTKNIARTIGVLGEEEQVVDQLEVVVHEPSAEQQVAMRQFSQKPYGTEETAQPAQEHGNGQAAGQSREEPGSPAEEVQDVDDDQDADGSEDN